MGSRICEGKFMSGPVIAGRATIDLGELNRGFIEVAKSRNILSLTASRNIRIFTAFYG